MEYVADWISNKFVVPGIKEIEGRPFAKSYRRDVDGTNEYKVQVCATWAHPFYRVFGLTPSQTVGIPANSIVWSKDNVSAFIEGETVRSDKGTMDALQRAATQNGCLKMVPCDVAVSSLCCSRQQKRSHAIYFIFGLLIVLFLIVVILFISALRGGYFKTWQFDIFNKPPVVVQKVKV